MNAITFTTPDAPVNQQVSNTNKLAEMIGITYSIY
jgi:hypothetical protein